VIIRILVVGKIKNNFIIDGVNEYLKRISPYVEIEILNLQNFTNLPPPEALKREEEIIFKTLKDSYYIALDQMGKPISSEELADLLLDFSNRDKKLFLYFVIGGIFGLSENVKKKARLVISLSKLTFTHEFALLILLEQIYRAFKIINREPYHY